MNKNDEAATVMVVDDTPENLNLLRDMLTEHGYRVLTFPNGKTALNAVIKNPPDLILLDIMMPGMNGFAVCKRLKEDKRLRNIPVLFISVLDETMDKVQAFSVGGLDYVTKPFQFEEVNARVKTHLRLRKMQIELEEYNIHLKELAEQNQSLLKTMEEELKWAGEMQKALLRPKLAGSERVDFRVSYRPVSSFYCGGDYYDVISLSTDRYLLLIGDVAGHGVRAAFITGILKAVIYPEYVRAALKQEFSPADFLSWLNERMNFELRKATGIFITFFAGVLDLQAGTLCYSNAGQNRPFVLRPNGLVELEVSGASLGVMSPVSYIEETVPIQRSDVLTLYTDGLIEFDIPGGKKTLEAFKLFAGFLFSQDFHKRVLKKALKESGASDFNDDVTLLTARIR